MRAAYLPVNAGAIVLPRREQHWPGSIAGSYAVGDLHPAILWLVAILFAGMVGVFWLGFVGPGDVFTSMAATTSIFIAAVVIPFGLAHTRRTFLATHGGDWAARKGTLGAFMAGGFETLTGRIPASSAALHILMMPACLAVAAALLAVVFRVVAYI